MSAAVIDRVWAGGRLGRAVEDLWEGLARAWVWHAMAWQDIRQRYRGSVLGPFWLTISMTVMIVSLGFLYSNLFKLTIDSYLPFLTLGLLFWTFLSTMVSEGCSCFILAEAMIRQVKMPFTTHVYRVVYRNLIVLAHNAVVYVAVALYFGLPVSAATLMVAPGLVVMVLNGVWVGLLLGMICARFRDVVPIVGSLIQVWFFLTPIFWDRAALDRRYGWLVEINPADALLEIVRAPLLGQPVAAGAWPLALGVLVVGWAVSLAFFARFRARIPFWV
jgi:ABC-type polysaccharide/polyol phosphate export permease